MEYDIQFKAITVDDKELTSNRIVNMKLRKMQKDKKISRPDLSPILITDSLDCSKSDIKELYIYKLKGLGWWHIRNLPNLKRVEFTNNIILRELIISGNNKMTIVNVPKGLVRLSTNKYSTITNLGQLIKKRSKCYISLD